MTYKKWHKVSDIGGLILECTDGSIIDLPDLNIKIEIIQIRNKKARVAVLAPKDVIIKRQAPKIPYIIKDIK